MKTYQLTDLPKSHGSSILQATAVKQLQLTHDPTHESPQQQPANASEMSIQVEVIALSPYTYEN